MPGGQQASSGPSIDELSPTKRALLDQRRSVRLAGSLLRPVPRGSEGLQLSFGQERLWLLDQLMPGLTAYNVVRAVRLRGDLDLPALAAALEAVVARHEVLRSRIVASADSARSMPMPPGPVAVPVVDLRPEPDPDAAAAAVLAAEADRSFDLATDLLLRARVLRCADDIWVLALTTHHIASDEGSREVLFADLAAAYAAARAGRTPALPAPRLQYGDWASWQRDRLAGPELATDLAWWRQQLVGAPAVLELPADRSAPTVPDPSGARYLHLLTPEQSAAVRGIGRRHGVTLYTTMLAALAAVLSRYAGVADVVVGSPVSGRSRPEVEGLIGYFSNMLALRVRTDGEPSWTELLGRTRTTVVEALAHAEVPFERLVAEIAPDRASGQHPLFQVALSVETGAEDVPELTGLTATPVEAAPAQAKFDLDVIAADLGPAGIRLEWEYRRARFDEVTVARISGHLVTMLGAVELVTPAERAELAAWGCVPVTPPAPSGPTLPERFTAVARAYPDRPAVRAADASLSYAELDAASAELADRLRAAGAGPGAVVAVALDRSSRLVVALLAVLRAGAAYLPIDPGFPPDRVRFMLADSGCRWLVTAGDAAAGLPATDAVVLRLDEEAAAAEPVPAGPGAALDDLAYVIYTSGSTGTPKGVSVEHGALANFLRSMAREPGLEATDVLVSVTTVSFDIAALELFLPLWVGASVVVATAADTVDPDRLALLLEQCGATVLQGTPATWRMLVDAGWRGRAALRALCGGEALPTPLAAQLQNRCAALWNLYGPTETTIWSLAGRVDHVSGPVPIGRPIEGTEVFVVDRAGRLAPVGVPGELLIGGLGVARGYLGRPELTAERFVRPEVAAGRRVYRTGDLVRWRDGGRLEFLGRVDNQVKLRGFRVELGEVEAALLAQPGVRDAAVLLREDLPGDPRLVGYVAGVEPLDPRQLRQALGRALPAYMVPATVVLLPELPRTPNRKLDRARLPAPGGVEPRRRGAEPPQTPVEKTLAGIWSALLGVAEVGRDDDFFDLGGHSLLIVALAARVRAELGVALPLHTAYAHSGLQTMADAVTAELLAAAGGDELDGLLDELEGMAGG